MERGPSSFPENRIDGGIWRRIMWTPVSEVSWVLLSETPPGGLEFMEHLPRPADIEYALSMPGGGVLQLAPGQITDDGELTLCLSQALLESRNSEVENHVGAAVGHDGIPAEMRNAVLACDTRGARHPRPDFLRPGKVFPSLSRLVEP